MKLSDIRGEKTLSVLSALIPPIAAIAADPEAAALLQKQETPQGADPRQIAAERIARGLPNLILRHREDLIAILSVLSETSPEEYAERMTLTGLLEDLMELLSDEELLRLFT